MMTLTTPPRHGVRRWIARLVCGLVGHVAAAPTSQSTSITTGAFQSLPRHCARCGVGLGLPVTEQTINMPPVKPPRRYDARCPTVQDCEEMDPFHWKQQHLYTPRCPTVRECEEIEEARQLSWALRARAVASGEATKADLLAGLHVTRDIVGEDAYLNDPHARAAVRGGMTVLQWIRLQQTERKRLGDEVVKLHQIGLPKIFIVKDKP
jgi:hypothetical protein